MPQRWDFTFVLTPVLPPSQQNGSGDSAVRVVNLCKAKEHADVVLRKPWVTKRLPLCWHEGPYRSCLPAASCCTFRTASNLEECARRQRPSALWLLVSRQVSVSHGVKSAAVWMPPQPGALLRYDLRLCTTYLTSVACGENDGSNAKTKPSDLASTHPPFAYPETFNDEDDEDRLVCVRCLEVLRSSKEFVEFLRDFLLFEHWSPVSFRKFRAQEILFLEARSALYAARDACVRLREPSRILFLLDNFGLVFALEKTEVPKTSRKQHVEQILRVTNAVRSHVLFPLDSIRMEQQRCWIPFLFALCLCD